MFYCNYFRLILQVFGPVKFITSWLLTIGVALIVIAVCCKKKKKEKTLISVNRTTHSHSKRYTNSTMRGSKGYERVQTTQRASRSSKGWKFSPEECPSTTTPKQTAQQLSSRRSSSGFFTRTGVPFLSAITTLTALSQSRDPDNEFLGDSTLSEVIGYKMPDVDLTKQYYEYMKRTEIKDEQQ
ncbi:hypothetical protein Mgra_00006402 [Meloidogyne graminicola]|uniref:Uncharacterized protein n=1 Tax=Meloidogyne graminicola TaxID=189291 RepID=A0A8S9ZLG0_9BILA|nr:hypothetical protein Mgra_00006402 [Meloidogyne graminicola]